MTKKCPTCESPDPARHPAVQFDGEVEICKDAFHQPSTDVLLPGEGQELAIEAAANRLMSFLPDNNRPTSDADRYAAREVIKSYFEVLNARGNVDRARIVDDGTIRPHDGGVRRDGDAADAKPWCWHARRIGTTTSAGPFDTKEQALAWAAFSFNGESWEAIPLYLTASPSPAVDGHLRAWVQHKACCPIAMWELYRAVRTKFSKPLGPRPSCDPINCGLDQALASTTPAPDEIEADTLHAAARAKGTD